MGLCPALLLLLTGLTNTVDEEEEEEEDGEEDDEDGVGADGAVEDEATEDAEADDELEATTRVVDELLLARLITPGVEDEEEEADNTPADTADEEDGNEPPAELERALDDAATGAREEDEDAPDDDCAPGAPAVTMKMRLPMFAWLVHW